METPEKIVIREILYVLYDHPEIHIAQLLQVLSKVCKAKNIPSAKAFIASHRRLSCFHEDCQRVSEIVNDIASSYKVHFDEELEGISE